MSGPAPAMTEHDFAWLDTLRRKRVTLGLSPSEQIEYDRLIDMVMEHEGLAGFLGVKLDRPALKPGWRIDADDAAWITNYDDDETDPQDGGEPFCYWWEDMRPNEVKRLVQEAYTRGRASADVQTPDEGWRP